MKQEKIKPGDILYNTHTKAIVKVARIDDNGCVKYSAYGKEPFTFYIEEYPYKMGADHADVFVPATDKQRKYIENQLSKRVYGYIPESTKTSDALIMCLGLMVKENVELEQRVHHLVEDYNRVARQLRGEEKHKPNTKDYTLGELTEALDKCEALEKDNKVLAAEKRDLEKQYNELLEKCVAAEGNYKDLRGLCDEYEMRINRFEQSEFLPIGQPCPHAICCGNKHVEVGTDECLACSGFLKKDDADNSCVLCSYRYDNLQKVLRNQKHSFDE